VGRIHPLALLYTLARSYRRVNPRLDKYGTEGAICEDGCPPATYGRTLLGETNKTMATYGLPIIVDAPVVADPAALTAVAAVGAAPDDDEYDALLADVTAIRTTLLAVVNALQANGLVTAS